MKRSILNHLLKKVICMHQGYRHIVLLSPFILGICFAFLFLKILSPDNKIDFEDAATFGAGTTNYWATNDGFKIHCADSRDVEECLDGILARHSTRSVLWLGNSQLHSVNGLRRGETTATPILFKGLQLQGLDLVTFSQPNANLQEHYLLFEYLSSRLPLQYLILPMVFDDTREDGLRKEVSNFLSDKNTKNALSKTSIGQKILDSNKPKSSDGNDDMAGITNTLQVVAEDKLNSVLRIHSQLWAERSEMRGQIFTGLYVLRNSIFRINPSSKRKMIRGRYLDNMNAFEAILASASERGISVLVYIAPLRSDVESPYVDSEYNFFKKDVERLSNIYGAKFSNLENLVPPELWGSKEGTSLGNRLEIDFMHFQGGGHRYLAQKILNLLTTFHLNDKP